ncbi:TIGR02253 family HAD-type hydrolase [Methanobrevibacter sp. DSM 116169]|uniref:TIGR02253 family HAD-type hydrolase n=1 Tax=Methanobrevibacter sp. DSM 116169 TaxID=3242727 RepID=UPI0038FCF65F
MDKVVFFDIDDTLLDTSSFAVMARKAAIDSIVENGLPLEKEEAYELLKEIIKEKGSNYDKHFNILTKRVLDKEDPLLIALGMITYHNVKFSLLRPYPKTNDILIYLKSKGYRLGVISNGITIKQWEKLLRLNLYPFFDEVITSGEVGFEKPSPYIFEEALKRMEGNPEKCTMIGNKFKEDVMGAVNAGMSAIYVNPNPKQEELDRIKDENLDIKVISNIRDVDKHL